MAMPATYEEFLDFAKDAARTIVPDAEIRTQKVEKLQGESYVGLSVRPENSNAAVTMNLHSLFEQVQENPKRLAAVMSEFLSGLESAIRNIPKVNADRFLDYDQVKGKLLMQVIPVEQNRERLSQIPHKTIEDIAVVYRISVSNSADHSATALVTNEMLENFGITQEQLHQDAVASQVANRPPTLRNMAEVMSEMTPGNFEFPESPLWVACVEGSVHGAAAVQCPEFMEQAAEKLGGDFFVLPSSIHECLFVPDNGEFDRRYLEEMVRTINKTEVEPADRLSDRVYHYDSRDKVFEMAETFEARQMVRESEALYSTIAEDVPAETEKDTISVLYVEPGKFPQAIEMGTELSDLQEKVGGFIETSYPFADNACLVLNDVGKLEGLPMNRALRDEDGKVFDIVAGSFLVVGIKGDSFSSLTSDQMKHYEEMFHSPEVFLKMGKSVMIQKVPDDAVVTGREKRAERDRGRDHRRDREQSGQEKDAGAPRKASKKKMRGEER